MMKSHLINTRNNNGKHQHETLAQQKLESAEIYISEEIGFFTGENVLISVFIW